MDKSKQNEIEEEIKELYYLIDCQEGIISSLQKRVESIENGKEKTDESTMQGL